MLEITHIQGGMREFERTGIYPEYLFFNLPDTKQSWTIRIKKTPQEGVLKSKDKVLYEYSFDGNWCKYRKVKSDCSFSEWMEPKFMAHEMRDWGVFHYLGEVKIDCYILDKIETGMHEAIDGFDFKQSIEVFTEHYAANRCFNYPVSRACKTCRFRTDKEESRWYDQALSKAGAVSE